MGVSVRPVNHALLRMAAEVIEFTVYGTPEPGGSKTAFPLPNRNYKRGMPKVMRFLHASDGRPIINVVDANTKAKGWKKIVAQQAKASYRGERLEGPLIVEMTFYRKRNADHYGSGKNSRLLRAAAWLFPQTKPDVLKLARPVEDALTGIVWVDDAQTVDLVLRKRYCDRHTGQERVEIRILPHAYATLGEKQAAAQELLPV